MTASQAVRAIAVAVAAVAVALAGACESSPTAGTGGMPGGAPPAAAPSATPPADPGPSPSPTVSAPPGAFVVACEASPRSGAAPLRVEFGSSASGGSVEYLYEWSFGDGAFATNPNPSHTYVNPGVYEAAVSITSGSESVTCSRSITVSAVSPPGGGPGPSPTPTPSPSATPSPSPTPAPPRQLSVSFTVWSNFAGEVTTQPPGITCSFPPVQTCVAPFAHGTAVTVIARKNGPPTGAGGVTITGACTASAPGGSVAQCTVTMNADKQVFVTFYQSSLQPHP